MVGHHWDPTWRPVNFLLFISYSHSLNILLKICFKKYLWKTRVTLKKWNLKIHLYFYYKQNWLTSLTNWLITQQASRHGSQSATSRAWHPAAYPHAQGLLGLTLGILNISHVGMLRVSPSLCLEAMEEIAGSPPQGSALGALKWGSGQLVS